MHPGEPLAEQGTAIAQETDAAGAQKTSATQVRLKSNWLDWVRLSLTLLELLCFGVGAWVGYEALKSYHAQASNQVGISLVDRDWKIAEYIQTHPEFEAVFLELPEGIPPRKRAERRLAMLNDGNHSGVRPWSDIRDLSCLLWEDQDFYSPAKVRLRQAYVILEGYLYIMSDAYLAMHNGLMQPEEYKAWSSYLDTIGEHPLFLVALEYWHRIGFLDADFAAEVRNRFKENPHAWEVIKSIFGDMEDASWPQRVRQERFYRCPPPPTSAKQAAAE